MAAWGRDHWSTLAFIETLCVDHHGGLSDKHRRNMRCNPERHPMQKFQFFHTMNARFVIENFSAVSAEIPDPTLTVVSAKDMVEIVTQAQADKESKLRVYEIGDCIFDNTRQ